MGLIQPSILKETRSEPYCREKSYRRLSPHRLIPTLFLCLFFAWSLIDLKISPILFWEGIPHFFNLVREMIPPIGRSFGEGRFYGPF